MTDLTTDQPAVAPARHLVARPEGDRRRSGPHRRDLLVSRLVAGAAAVGGAFAGGAPTGNRAADLALTMVLAAVVTLAASRARRWTGMLLAGSAAALAGGLAARLVANAALAVAIGTSFRRRRSRPWGSVAGALAIQVLLRLPTSGWTGRFHGLTALAAAAAIVPVLVSAHRVAGRRQRALERRVLAGAGALVVLATVALSLAVLSSRARAAAGIDDLRAGLARLAVSDPGAGARLASAAESLAATRARVDGWWSKPARLVPVLGQHAAALSTLTREGSALARAAADSAAAGIAGLRASGGRVDLQEVGALAAPLRRLETVLAEAGAHLRATGSPWLVAPLASRQAGVVRQVDRATSAVRTAVDAVRVLPDLLGAGGPRRYVIAFVTPAESRGSGGYMGNYGELTADGGALSLSRSGRTLDLMEHRRQPPDLAGAPADYVARYGRFRPQEFLGDLAYSPDFPTVATVLEQQYQRSTGVAVDGAVSIDPYALAALLQLTGPIQVPGLGGDLSAGNAAQFLLRDQYVRYPDLEQRVALLQRITDVLFQRLTAAELPPLGTLAHLLGPVVRQGRLAVHSTDRQAQALLGRVGLDGSLPPAGDGDFLSVVTQNSANNKIDVFLERGIDYKATVDPGTGRLRATVEVILRNAAPASGLPDYVIGGTDPRLPHGTNRIFVSVYTPHRLASAALDGHDVPMETQRELGRLVHATFVTIGPGGTATLRLELEGRVAAGRYRLGLAPQPLVNPDQVTVRVDPAGGWRLDPAGGFEPAGRSVVARPRPDQDRVLQAVARGAGAG